MIYIIDIDGTICSKVDSDYKDAVPYLDRIEKINFLYDQGNEINYWTARGGKSGIDWSEVTEKQLIEWGCKYHSLKMGKPSYDVWIDDLAINADEYF